MDARKPFANLILSVTFVCAFSPMAMASDIAFYVGAVPGAAYDTATMKKDSKSEIGILLPETFWIFLMILSWEQMTA